jgi:hypothetical protein
MMQNPKKSHCIVTDRTEGGTKDVEKTSGRDILTLQWNIANGLYSQRFHYNEWKLLCRTNFSDARRHKRNSKR